MRRFQHHLSVSLVVAAVLLALGVAPSAAGTQTCGVPIDVGIANGGFEIPVLNEPIGGVRDPGIDSWTKANGFAVTLWNDTNTFLTFSSGTQHVQLGDSDYGSASVSQALDGATLAGSTVTFQIVSKFSGTVTLGDQSQAVSGSDAEQTHTVTFDVPAGATGSLTLTLTGNSWHVDQISGTYVVPCTGPVIPPGCVDAVAAGENVVFVAEGGTGGSGRQVIIGTDGPDWIEAGSGDDLVCGGGGADTIIGGSGFDVLYGDDGDDWLGGGSKDDLLDGGVGWDTCDGGSGSNQLLNCEA